VDAGTGEQEWAFETGDFVESSPTVVDGTVYVGSFDDKLYAVDAGTGEQEWAFESGGAVFSSPTVVNGTVYVGSKDNSLYAVDAGVKGSSEGSRAQLGTLGHHGDWKYADQSLGGVIEDGFEPLAEYGDVDSAKITNRTAFEESNSLVITDRNEESLGCRPG
jgi:hypothetical protein